MLMRASVEGYANMQVTCTTLHEADDTSLDAHTYGAVEVASSNPWQNLKSINITATYEN